MTLSHFSPVPVVTGMELVIFRQLRWFPVTLSWYRTLQRPGQNIPFFPSGQRHPLLGGWSRCNKWAGHVIGKLMGSYSPILSLKPTTLPVLLY